MLIKYNKVICVYDLRYNKDLSIDERSNPGSVRGLMSDISDLLAPDLSALLRYPDLLVAFVL